MMTAKAEQMLKEGGASLDRMQDDMARAMQQMQQDPRVMNEMAKVSPQKRQHLREPTPPANNTKTAHGGSGGP